MTDVATELGSSHAVCMYALELMPGFITFLRVVLDVLRASLSASASGVKDTVFGGRFAEFLGGVSPDGVCTEGVGTGGDVCEAGPVCAGAEGARTGAEENRAVAGCGRAGAGETRVEAGGACTRLQRPRCDGDDACGNEGACTGLQRACCDGDDGCVIDGPCAGGAEF